MKKFWIGLSLLISQAAFAMTNLQATSTSTTVSYSYSYSGTPAFLRIFLDTDKNAGTGYAYQGIGANFLIENGTLYKYTGTGGSNWSWASVGSSNMVNSAPNVKWTISRTALGSPTGINLVANTSAGDNSGILTQSLSTTAVGSPINMQNVTSDSGYAYYVAQTFGTPADTATLPNQSVLQIYENGKLLGPAHSLHADIRTYGLGRFSHWMDGTTETLRFSSSDNTDPRTNGRSYTYTIGTSTATTTTTTTTTTLASVTTTTLATTSGSTATVNYSESSANIPNPERGMFWHSNCDSQAISGSWLQSVRANDGNTLIRCVFYLTNYKNSAIPQSVLDFFQTQMNTLRANGFKAVLLFAYTQNTAGDDAPVSVVLNHINQLAPYLQNNADVIDVLHAGFIGAWGEWAYSQNFGNDGNLTTQNWTDRKAVLDKLLSVLPSNRMIRLRTPRYKQYMYGSTALADSEAFTGTARARIGQHNDCFLASSNDWGTYTNTSTEYPWLQQETKYLPMGGETCNLNSPRSDCSTAMQEMAMFHWSDINQGYEPNVISSWQSQGCFATIKNKLGYRFVLTSGTYSTSAKVGGGVSVTFNLVNRGYASPFNPRGLQLVLRNNSTGAVFKIPLNADPRRWLPGSTITVSQTVTLPTSLPAGNYSMLLNLPDPATSLATRADYAIQLANINTWESSTGYNSLNATLTVNP